MDDKALEKVQAEIEGLKKDFYTVHGDLKLIAQQQEQTTKNVQSLAESLAKTLDSMPQFLVLENKVTALHTRMDKAEEGIIELDKHSVKSALTTKIVFGIISIMGTGVISLLLSNVMVK